MEYHSDRHGMPGAPRHAAQSLQAVISGGPCAGFHAGLCATSANLTRGKTSFWWMQMQVTVKPFFMLVIGYR